MGAGIGAVANAQRAGVPIVVIGGRVLDIQVQVPLANLLTMRSTTLTVIIPQNVSGFVLLDDISAFPMQTTISPTGPAWSGIGRLPITIQAHVEASSAFPVRVVATPVLNLGDLFGGPSSAEGIANSLVTLQMSLG